MLALRDDGGTARYKVGVMDTILTSEELLEWSKSITDKARINALCDARNAIQSLWADETGRFEMQIDALNAIDALIERI